MRSITAVLVVCCLTTPALTQENRDTDVFSPLEYRHIGPIGNRVSAVVGVPGDARIYYIGAASGGIFRTVDGGVTWEPVFDDQPVSSIGSLALAPSDPSIVWAGTGETFIRSNVSIGNGIYRSTDGGKTWERRGLEKTGRIGRILIHPRDPDIVYAAAMGHCYGPQQERGVYRTRDGGQSWERVLFSDPDTGASDLVMDPNNPRILFAGMWPMQIWPWGRQSGGPGGGLFTSRDGGDTWKRLEGNGLPRPPTGKIALTMSPDDSRRVYALIETNSNRDFAELTEHQGVLWRSDDGGGNWKMVNASHTLAQRPHYYSRLAVLPDDHNEVHFMAFRHYISLDGGVTTYRGNAGGDHHDIWIDPLLPRRMIVGHDQGVSISNNRGKTWFRPQLPIAQMYHVATDNRVPYYVYGNRQDGSSVRGPSNSLTGGEIPVGAWVSVGGCESGFAVPDPVDSNTVWSGCYDGILDIHDLRTGHSRNVSIWPDAIESWAARDLKYRIQWTFPVTISPHDNRRVYTGSQYVHVTTNGGQSWSVISPDLTGDNESGQIKTGGLTPDDAGPTIAPVVFAIAESPLEKDQVWAGTNDGRLHLTHDGGRNWTDLTANLPGLPEWGTVSNIEPSPHRAGTCYVTVDRHQMGDTNPYVFRTRDYGATWSAITDGIPVTMLSYTHCVREDPVREGLLYLGTENGLYVSFDDGDSWRSLQNNLPHAPVHWLEIQSRFNDLVAATYGRGFWILDDITPLQQWSPEVEAAGLLLLEPRPAYRFQQRARAMSQPNDPAAGTNPRYGAYLHFVLGPGDEESPVTVEVLDSRGNAVRRFSTDAPEGTSRLEARKGLNRLVWDLRYESPRQVKLRTRPLEHSHVSLGDRGWREMEEARRGTSPRVPPGRYTVRLTRGEQVSSRELTVLKDPNSEGSEQTIADQHRIVWSLYQMVNQSADIINAVERVRAQLENLRELIESREETSRTLETITRLQERLMDFEGNFFDLRLSGSGQDTLRWPRQLWAKLNALMRWIGQSDFRPTDQQVEVHEMYRAMMADYQREWAEIRREISSFNSDLADEGMAGLIVP